MRASRILALLLLLQRHGRTSAAELARTLEVSERTVRRDVEALSEAGVPVYAVRGYRGGIELVGGFATHLTGLTPEEAGCLLLVGQPRVAHRLGLAAPTRLAGEKLMTALGPALTGEARGLSSWFLHDPDPDGGHRIPHGELRRLASCVQRRRVVEIVIGDAHPRPVRPLGLVLKAGSWRLVVAVEAPEAPSAVAEVVTVDDLRGTRVTRVAFEPPPDFDLARFWASEAH